MQYRALKTDFRDLWDADIRIKPLAMAAWLNHHNIKGTKNGMYGQLQRGRPVSVIYITAFVEYVSRSRSATASDEYDIRQWETLKGYLEEKCGIEDAAAMPVSAMVEHVSYTTVSSKKLDDWFNRSCEIMGTLYTSKRVLRREPWRAVKLCSSDPTARSQDVAEAVEWIFVELGRDVADNTSLSAESSIQRGEECLKITMQDFTARANEWCAFEPWTVVRCFKDGKITGVSICLPLKPDVYHSIRNGERPTYDCNPGDMTSVSSHVLVQALAPRTL